MLKHAGLKYKFMAISITAIVVTAILGITALHFLLNSGNGYSPVYLIGVAVFYILVGTLGVFVLSKVMIQPVVYLTEKIYQIQQGNLDVRIEKLHQSGWMDEMDRLFQGFHHMLQNLRENIEALTRSKEEAERISQESFQRKTKLEAILNGISDGIMVLDKDYRIVGANPVIQNFMGRSFEEIQGQHCYEMCNGSPQRCSFCRADITFKDGKHVTSYCTKPLVGSDDERILEIHDFPLYNENGEVEQIIEYIKDVTDAVQMQARLESARRLAEIGEMAAKIAHEVRNPLSAIGGATHYLRGKIDNADVESYLDLIEEQIQRVNHVATELLNLSKPLPPVFHPGNLKDVIEKSLILTRPQLSQKQISVEIEIPGEIPAIPLDEHKMEQALVNIILNSVDAMVPGGHLQISAAVLENQYLDGEKSVILKICDDGCGVEQAKCTQIFNPFFTTKTKGTGLGLTIVKKIVEHHQGTIEFNSRCGEGSEIILSLPLKPRKNEKQSYDFSH